MIWPFRKVSQDTHNAPKPDPTRNSYGIPRHPDDADGKHPSDRYPESGRVWELNNPKP